MDIPVTSRLTAAEAIEECLRVVNASLPGHDGSTCCRALRGQISHELIELLRRERALAKAVAGGPVPGA